MSYTSKFLVWLTALITGLSITLQAQQTSWDQLEIELTEATRSMVPLPIDSLGVLLMQEVSTGKNNPTQMLVSRYDRNLKRVWQVQIPDFPKFSLSQYKHDGTHLYMVYTSPSMELIKVVKLNLQDASNTLTDFYAMRNISYYGMEILENKIYLVGALNDGSALFLLDPKTKSNKLLNTDLGTPQQTVVKNVWVDPVRKTLGVTLAVENRHGQEAAIRTFDQFGQMVGNMPLALQEDFRVLEAKQIVEGPSGKHMVVGTYTYPELARAQGVFFQDGGLIRYHAFADMTHFLQYAQEPVIDKDAPKSLARKIKSDEIAQKLFVALNNILYENGKIYLVTEAYDLVYNRLVSQPTDKVQKPHENLGQIWASNNLNTYQIRMEDFNQRLNASAGYLLKYVSVLNFDHQGNLLWDRSLLIGDGEPIKQYKQVRARLHQEGLLLVNDANGTARWIRKDGNINDQFSAFQQTDRDGNVRQVLQPTSTAHWYRDYYLQILVKEQPVSADNKKQSTLLKLTKVKS